MVIFDCMKDPVEGWANWHPIGHSGMEEGLVRIEVVRDDDGGYEAQLTFNDTYRGGGTLTRALSSDIFVDDFDAFVENLCQATSVSWFKADPERVKRRPGLRKFFGYPPKSPRTR